MRRSGVLAAALAIVLGAVLLAPSLPAGASSVLPNDPAASGYVGLCNEAGQNVTGGSITERPFVWKAVSTMTPPKQYLGLGQNTSLTVYQPRPDTLPAYWSGDALTAASFSKAGTPLAAQATYDDLSLEDFIKMYPPEVDGLYVLRMDFGRQDFGLYDRTYPTTTIQVVGNRWHLISGGTVDCSASHAISNEQLTGVVTKSAVTPRKPSAVQTVVTTGKPAAISESPSPKAGGGSASAATSSGGSPAGSPAESSAGANQPGTHAPGNVTDPPKSQASTQSSSGTSWVLWALLAAVVALALALALVLRTRAPRNAARSTSSSDLS